MPGLRRISTLLFACALASCFAPPLSAEISGSVFDEDGKPIPGAKVECFVDLAVPNESLEAALRRLADLEALSSASPSSTTTDSQGKFRVAPEPGWYHLRVSFARKGTLERSKISSDAESLKFTLKPNAAFEVSTRNASGPLTGARVIALPVIGIGGGLLEVVGAKTRPALADVRSDERGLATIESLAPGVYDIGVTAADHEDAEVFRVELAHGKLTKKEITLTKGQVIKGRLVDARGAPVKGASIRPTRTARNAGRSNPPLRVDFDEIEVLSDADGHFRLSTLSRGEYSLLIVHPGFAPQLKSRINTRGDDDVIVNATLDEGLSISGVILGPDSKPVPDATIATTLIRNIGRETTSDAEGRFELKGFRKGLRACEFIVSSDRFARLSARVDMGKPATIKLDYPASLTGRVVQRGPDRQPLTGAKVRIYVLSKDGRRSYLGNTLSTADGSFVFERLNPQPGKVVIEVERFGFLSTEFKSWALRAGQTTEVGDLSLEMGSILVGNLRNADDAAVTPAELTLVYIDDNASHKATANSAGRFSFGGLRSGEAKLSIQAKRYLEHSVTVQVPSGKSHDLGNIALKLGRSLVGKVVDSAGKGIPGAAIVVRDFSNGLQEHRAIATPEGEFDFHGLSSQSSVEVEVKHTGFQTLEQEVQLTGKPVQLICKQLGSLRGRVILDDGTPVPKFVVRPIATRRQRNALKTLRVESPDGSFEYKGLAPGLYRLRIGAIRSPTKTIDDIRVVSGPVDLGTIELPAGHSVEGTVFIGKKPAAGVRVSALDGRYVDGTRAILVKTGADGRFKISRLNKTKVVVLSSLRGYLAHRIPDITPGSPGSKNLEIHLEVGNELKGVLLDSQGKPAANQSVTILGEKLQRLVKTDGKGRFSFKGLAAGKYRVKSTIRVDKKVQRAENEATVPRAKDLELRFKES